MKRILFTILFLSGSLFLLTAKDLTVNVVDRDLELPLEGVRIREVDSGIIVFTDEDGNVVITVPDVLNRAVIIAELVGYESRKILVKDFKEPLIIEMLMEGILEEQELVVEEEAIGVARLMRK